MPAEERRAILIANGDDAGREKLVKAFEGYYDIMEAKTSREALDSLAKIDGVAGVILAPLSPGMDGFSVLKAIRADARFESLPVLAVTTSDAEAQNAAFDAGATDVVDIPFNLETARRRLGNIVRRERREPSAIRLGDRQDSNRSLRLVETIIRNIPGGLAEFKCERGKPIRTYLSEDAYRILGYSETDPPASTLEEAFSRVNPIDRAIALDIVEKSVKNVTTMVLDMRVNPVGKGVRWINFVAYPNKNFDGTVYFYGIYTDVTKQKALEAARRLSISGMGERRRTGQADVMHGAWRELFIQSDEMLFIKDVDLIYLAVSKPFAEMVGANDPDEIVGKTDLDIFRDAELARRYTQDDMRILHTGLNMENFIEPIADRDGCPRFSSTSKYAVRDEDGRIVGILGRGRDITQNMQNNQYRESFVRPGRTFFRYVIKGRRMEMPPKAMEDYAVPSSIDDGPDYFVRQERVSPESREAWLSFFIRIDGGETEGEAEIKMINAAGATTWLRMQFTGVAGEKGEASFAIVSYEDITRRRDSDKSLSVEYMGFYSAMRTVYSLSIAVNLTQNSYYMLDKERYICKRPKEKGVFDDLVKIGVESVPEADKRAFAEAFSRKSLLSAFESGKSVVTLEHRQFDDEGTVHWVETTVLRIDNPYDGDVLEFTLARTIDDKKADEEKLKKALEMTSGALNDRLRFIRLVDDIFPGLICVYDPATGKADSITGGLCKLYGYTRDEFTGMLSSRFSRIPHPEDEKDIANALSQIESELPENFEYELRVHKKDSGSRYVTFSGKRFATEDAQTRYICLVLDGTARRELTDGLRMSGEEIKLCMARMGKIIFRYDAVERLFKLPGEYAAAVGVPEECADVVGKLRDMGFALAPGEENRETFENFEKALYAGERLGSCEVEITRPKGERSWMRLEFAGIFDADDRCARAVISVEDVTVKRAYADENRRLRESGQIMKAVADNSDRVAYYYDIAQRVASSIDEEVSRKCELPSRFADPPEEQISQGLIAPESAESYRAIFKSISLGVEKDERKLRVRRGENGWRWLEMRFVSVNSPGEKPAGAVITLLDITRRHEQELTYARYIQSMRSSDDKEVLFFETDLTRDVIEQQGGMFSPFHLIGEGLSHTDVANYIAENYFDESARGSALEIMNKDRLLEQFRKGVTNISNDWDVVFDDGQTHWVRSNMQMVTDPYTGHVRLLTVINDITGEKLDELSLHKRAQLDGLTGVLNRATVESRIRQALESADECAMTLIDVDDLKMINDTYGHAQGDRALCRVAGELSSRMGENDLLGRLGGDEFVAFAPRAKAYEIIDMLARIKKRLFGTGANDYTSQSLRFSAGIAMSDGKGETFDTLYKKADAALYEAKRRGKNGFAFYGGGEK